MRTKARSITGYLSFNKKLLILSQLVVVFAALTLVAGCRKSAPLSPAASLPGDASMALVVPSLDSALGQIKSLHVRLQKDFPDISKLVEDFQRVAGFNILLPNTLRDIGFEPKGGVGVSLYEEALIVSLPVSNSSRANDYLKEKLKGAFEEIEIKEVEIGKTKGLGLFTGDDKKATAAWVWDKNSIVMAVVHRNAGVSDVDAVELLARVQALPEGERLDAQEYYKKVNKGLGEGGVLRLVGDAKAVQDNINKLAPMFGLDKEIMESLGELSKMVEAGGINLLMDRETLGVSAHVLLTEEGAKMQEQLRVNAGKALDLGRLVDNDAVMVFKLGWHPDKSFNMIRSSMGAMERAMLQQGLASLKGVLGFDIETDILQHLTGRVAFAFYKLDQQALAGTFGMGQKGAPSLGAVTSATFVQVKDSKAIETRLIGLQAKLREHGIDLSPKEAGKGTKYWDVSMKGEHLASWVVKDDLLVLTTGADRMVKSVKSLSGEQKGLGTVVQSQQAKDLLAASKSAGLMISVPNLLRQFPIIHIIPMASKGLSYISEVVVSMDLSKDGKTMSSSFTVSLTGGK